MRALRGLRPSPRSVALATKRSFLVGADQVAGRRRPFALLAAALDRYAEAVGSNLMGVFHPVDYVRNRMALGFVLIRGTTRNGKFLLRRKSRRDRMRAKLREIKEELRRRMHRPIPETGKWLAQVVSGFQAYHAVPTNRAAIGAFRYRIIGLWHRVLCRRSQKGGLVWQRMTKLADEFLPTPHVLHPWPSARFAVRHPR